MQLGLNFVASQPFLLDISNSFIEFVCQMHQSTLAFRFTHKNTMSSSTLQMWLQLWYKLWISVTNIYSSMYKVNKCPPYRDMTITLHHEIL